MIHEKVKNIKWKKDEYGITFDRIEIPLRHDMTATLEVELRLDYDRLYASSESPWVTIEYKDKTYDLTEYEIDMGYPYDEEWNEDTPNTKLPRDKYGDYHNSWFKKLKENTDYLIKKADEIYGF
jgi:hypothetical protein